jgi:GNAT superfamily N-acetyltransferase
MMSDYSIRRMDLSEIKNIYVHIVNDFAPGEYAPYEILFDQIKDGELEGLILCNGPSDLAYAICAVNKENRFVLLSLMAVFPENRGSGTGTAFVKALCLRYCDMQGIIVEVEKPEFAQLSSEQEMRTRRMAFYKKLGFYRIRNIDYTIWDVPLHLMALPIKASNEFINTEIGVIIYQIYFRLMGKRLMYKLAFRVLEE